MRAAVVFVVCFFGAVACFAADDDDDDLAPLSLSPLPLSRPKPKVLDADPPPLLGACVDDGLPMLRERLPFGPGESLTFELALVGVRAGRVGLRVDDKARVDGVDVYPVVARARTDRFLAAFGAIDASMVSFLDPQTVQPLRMANRAVTRELFDQAPSTTREDAVFAPSTVTPSGPRGARVNARLDHFGKGKQTVRDSKPTSRADVVDVLSIVYWLRSRELKEGQRFCFELFHRRRLWRVFGAVGGVVETASPYATKKARRLDLSVLRARPGQEARPLTVFVSDDDDRLPLILNTSDQLQVRLTGFTRGRTLSRSVLPSSSNSPVTPPPDTALRPADNPVVR